MLDLVVCGFADTIANFEPRSPFSSVLLPAFGLPAIATWPNFDLVFAVLLFDIFFLTGFDRTAQPQAFHPSFIA